MSKLFVLSHPKHRFCSDYFRCGTHEFRAACTECGANLNGWRPPLLYWWDYEFGSPQASLDAGHNCFWGSFSLMVDETGKSLLDSLKIPFSFHSAKMTEGKSLNGQESLTLKCVTIDCSIKADPTASQNLVCPKCGTFAERSRQITRLRVPAQNVPDLGVFTIQQNGESGPIFVTEAALATIVATGISGLGAYPAGRIL